MIAVVPLLHEIIPHGTMRVGLVAPDATITAAYDEHPAAAALYRERFWRFMDDPSALASLWVPACRAVGTLEVHNPAELGTKIWLGQKLDETRQYLRRAV
jgi:hypothetical protein